MDMMIDIGEESLEKGNGVRDNEGIFDCNFFYFYVYLGIGAYFAHNPRVSHNYTVPDPTNQTRIMYYNKVTLGNESIVQVQNANLVAAPKGYHSTHGQFPSIPDADEYIVYRYGQALPYLKITYKA
jgi:hypothetical protein